MVASNQVEQALFMLTRQLGVVKFQPLTRHILSIYAACRVSVPAMPPLQPLTAFLERPGGLPLQPLTLVNAIEKTKNVSMVVS